MILALMPLGVEHLRPLRNRVANLAVILALMPLGVEHARGGALASPTSSDPRIDAVRR